MTNLDAEAKKLGDFQKRQARLLDKLHQRTQTASGFEQLEKLVGVAPPSRPLPPPLDPKQLFPQRFGPDGQLVTKVVPRR